jgi:hypothetical protein
MGLARALGTSPSQAGKMLKCGHTIRAMNCRASTRYIKKPLSERLASLASKLGADWLFRTRYGPRSGFLIQGAEAPNRVFRTLRWTELVSH